MLNIKYGLGVEGEDQERTGGLVIIIGTTQLLGGETFVAPNKIKDLRTTILKMIEREICF